MRSQSNSPVVTFFMLAPLLAIPLLAVFGIPNMQTSKSISAAIDNDIELGDATVADPSTKSKMDEIFKSKDPFKPIEMDHAFSDEKNAHHHHHTKTDLHSKTIPAVHHPEALQGWSVEEAATSRNQNLTGEQNRMGSPSRRDISERFQYVERDDLSADLSKTSIAQVRPNSFLALSDKEEASRNPFLDESSRTSFGKNVSKSSTSPALPTTWKGAVARLNKYGIHDFNLQPGVNKNEFYFNCSYTPKENPRITHRFESEASDPLLAVQNAILQVEEWQRAR